MPDENTVGDEGPNKDALVPAVSVRLMRRRVSSGDVEAKIDDGERDVDGAEVDDAKSDGDDDGESHAEGELAPRRERVMSQANMLNKAGKELEGKKQNAVPLFDSARDMCTNARAMRCGSRGQAHEANRVARWHRQAILIAAAVGRRRRAAHVGGVAAQRGGGQGAGGGQRGGQSNCGIGGHRERACRGRAHQGARRGP